MKTALKRMIRGVPWPVGRCMVEGLCAAGVLDPAYRVYFKLGRPARVLAGPFAGMRFSPVTTSGSWLPKLLGTYERELHPTVERLAAEPCDRFIDIGSAEGYYAVGMTMRLRPARTVCCEVNPRGHALMRRYAALNGVADRIETHGACSPVDLDRLLHGCATPVILCDIDGGEDDLLRPEAAPHLRGARLVVEVHPWARPADQPSLVTDLCGRFAATHDVEEVPNAGRGPGDFPAGLIPAGAALSDAERRAAVNEGNRNASVHWLVFRPKSAG